MNFLFSKFRIWIRRHGLAKVVFLLAIIGVALLAPNISNAQASLLFDFGFKLLSKVAFGISYVVALIGGLFVGVLIIALQMVLQISDGIVNSLAVQTGFPIVLSIANLGFVLAIIIISLATILRQEGYGIKKLLANVIIMAVLVNFGLVISGAILGFSNRITNYFLDSMTGGGATDFASIMAGTMNPQKAFLDFGPAAELVDTEAATSTVITKEKETEAYAKLGQAAKDGGSFGSLILPLFSVLLTIVNIVIMIVTLAVLLVTFILRYIKITFYLILLPAAWMASVFPGLKSWSGKWWHSFIQQAFYPPVVIFFLWLAMRVATGLSDSDGLKFEAVKTGGGGITDFLGNLIGTPLQGILQAAIIAGLMLGGDYAGKALGVAGAGAAIKASNNMQGWASGKVKTGMRRAGVRSIDTARSIGSSKAGQAVANSGVGRFAAKITSVPGISGLTRIGGNAINRYTTRAKEQMGASVSKSYKDNVAKMGEDELKVRSKVATGLELAAILDKASKDPKLMTAVLKNISDANKKSMAADEDLYKRYGYGKAHEAAVLESGIKPTAAHQELKDAKAKRDAVANDPAATEEKKVAAETEFTSAINKFAESIKKLSPDGANSLLFAKDKDGKFTMPDDQRKDMMQSLITSKGWTTGKFNEFIQKAYDGENDSALPELFANMDVSKTNQSIIRALENGAMKNLGVEGESVMGKELFAKAKEHHGIGEKEKEEKKNKKGGPTTAVFE